MRSLTVFLLIGTVLYGSFCAAGAKANWPWRARGGFTAEQKITLSSSVPTPDTLSCHAVSQTESTPETPSPTGDCCEANFDFAVSSWSLDDVALVLFTAYFFLPDFACTSRDAQTSAMAETSTDPTDFPSLQILHARFLI